MADIAFLLLIFFLVTTTIAADKGIIRKLPSECPLNEDCTIDKKERNILRINLNANQEILVEDEIVNVSDIKLLVKSFVDNNGDSVCDYCEGEQSSTASDHPKDAVISLSHDALTQYQLFITVQDEISKAYYDLRTRFTMQKYNKSPGQLSKEEFEIVKKAYPFIVSEVMVKRSIDI
jgi:biopolymer transport protein ExbD